MRILLAIAAISALALAQPAVAAPVTLAPVTISPALQAEIEDTYGAREAAYLQNEVTRQVSRALARSGANVSASAPVTIETAIVDARPNRPTMQQLSDTPGLDMFHSVSIGGAELTAVLRGADGRVLSEVAHERYSTTLAEAGLTPWADARRAITQFARKVADAYVANAVN